ncbi:MAG: HlyD family efflux transporter periplasmic adaptor subunit [Bacteroidales bacterium]|nr:HlyD family efflux transporter periplasmic adaptor subunit [Bacteroidales bacterium]
MEDKKTINEVEREDRRLLASLGILVLVMIGLFLVGMFLIKPAKPVVQGEVDARSVRVSGKLPGRVTHFYVQEGDRVKAGDTLVHIYSSTVDAKLYQAQMMADAASAQNAKVDAGARIQVVNSARDLWLQAQAAEEIAKKTYVRLENLYKQGVVSEQKRDEARAAYDAAVAQSAAAKSQYDMAVEGAQKEDKKAALAMKNAARGGVMEVESILEDQYLTAPCDGEISEIYPNEGELVATGAPVMSVLQIEDAWVVFNVREEMLNTLTMDKEIEVMIPALADKVVKARVFYIRDMGSYAVWSATKAAGEYDSKTFEVKARPMEQVENLRPGMSGILIE